MLYKRNVITLELLEYSWVYILMSIGLWAQEAIFTHFNCMWTLCGHIELFGTSFVFG